jgi:hypothetical protein
MWWYCEKKHKYGKVKLINKGFLNTNTAITLATNAISWNGRSRMEVTSAGKREYGGKGR